MTYDAFAEDVLNELNPRGPLETLAADRVVETAWQLKSMLDRRAARAEVSEGNPDKAPANSRRASASVADRALRSMRDALETLDHLQSRHALDSLHPFDPAPPVEEPDPAVVVFDPNSDGDASDWLEPPFDVPATTGDAPGGKPVWENRLVFDFEVSDISPVVKGTWVTVSQVVSLIVDGYSWAEILRTHPELSQDDIHACMVYALDEMNDPR